MSQWVGPAVTSLRLMQVKLQNQNPINTSLTAEPVLRHQQQTFTSAVTCPPSGLLYVPSPVAECICEIYALSPYISYIFCSEMSSLPKCQVLHNHFLRTETVPPR